jgi:flagellar biosynthesis protein FlhB
MSEHKGHAPSYRKLERARKSGSVIRSRILTQFSAAAGAAVAAWWLMRLSWVSPTLLLNYCFIDVQGGDFECARSFIWSSGTFLAISLGAGAVTGVLAETLQVGVKVSLEPLSPSAERLNPFMGLARLGTGVLQTWRSLVMVAVLLGACGLLGVSAFSSMPGLLAATPAQLVSVGESWCVTLSLVLAGGVLGAGVLEYALNRRTFMREMSMSLDELRREHRESDGDPALKSARRALHGALARGELEQRVRQARVVVVQRNTSSRADSS